MSGFAVIGFKDAYLSSLGIFLDSFELIRRQVSELYRNREPIAMQTPIRLLTLDGQPVRLADGRPLPADGQVDDSTQYDLIHLPSFLVMNEQSLISHLDALTSLYDWLFQQHMGGAYISASGSAVFVLAEAGLLQGKSASLGRSLMPIFRKRYPNVRVSSRQAIVEHNRIVTSSGIAADAQLLARMAEHVTTTEMGRWLSDAISLHQVSDDHLADDPLTANAQLWIEERFTQTVRIDEMAKAMAVSQQTLLRHFRQHLNITPQQYIRQIRIKSAQNHLLRTSRSIEQIATLSGYSDVHAFRKVFRELTGLSPSQFRTKYKTGTISVL